MEKGQGRLKVGRNSSKLTCILLCENLGVFAEDFGVEADPVVGDKHLALVQDVSLQSARVACRPRQSQLAQTHGCSSGGGE